jgi:hypothetical protein
VVNSIEDAIAAWENEGGSAIGPTERRVISTVQIAWADQIKVQVGREFDRVRRVLESLAPTRSPQGRTQLAAIIRILEDKRAEVMANENAGYFIHDWQDLDDHVRQLIVGDPRYEAVKKLQTKPDDARARSADEGNGLPS